MTILLKSVFGRPELRHVLHLGGGKNSLWTDVGDINTGVRLISHTPQNRPRDSEKSAEGDM